MTTKSTVALSVAVTTMTTRPTTTRPNGSLSISARGQTWPTAPSRSRQSVKWFNADKGFGFVTVAEGADAFLPARALEMSGHNSVPDGARLKVRYQPGAEGSSGRRSPRGGHEHCSGDEQAERRPSPRPSLQRPGAGPTEECLGSVKWYNGEKGFRFRSARPWWQGCLRSCHHARSERIEWAGGRSACADADQSGAERAGGSIN